MNHHKNMALWAAKASDSWSLPVEKQDAINLGTEYLALLEILKLVTTGLQSACLVITDDEARGMAMEMVAEAKRAIKAAS